MRLDFRRDFTLIARLDAEDFAGRNFGFIDSRELRTTQQISRAGRVQTQTLTREYPTHTQLPALPASEFDAVGWLVTTVCCLS